MVVEVGVGVGGSSGGGRDDVVGEHLAFDEGGCGATTKR